MSGLHEIVQIAQFHRRFPERTSRLLLLQLFMTKLEPLESLAPAEVQRKKGMLRRAVGGSWWLLAYSCDPILIHSRPLRAVHHNILKGGLVKLPRGRKYATHAYSGH